MTSDQFRKSAHRDEWRRLLSENVTIAQVLIALREERPMSSLPFGADALERAAALARIEQHEADCDLLFELSQAPPVEPEAEESTFGVDKSQFASQSQSILR